MARGVDIVSEVTFNTKIRAVQKLNDYFVEVEINHTSCINLSLENTQIHDEFAESKNQLGKSINFQSMRRLVK